MRDGVKTVSSCPTNIPAGPRVVAECAEWLVSLPLLDSGYSGRLGGAAHLRTEPIWCKLHSHCIVRP